MHKKLMFSILILSLIIFVGITSAVADACTYYVSSSTGNDTQNDGTSASTPWQTIDKINKQNLIAGDTVCFKRGDSWRIPIDAHLALKSGDSSGYVTYTAYGSGPKPVFLGSVKKNSVADWALWERSSEYPNIWTTPDDSFKYLGVNHRVGNLIFNNEQSTGKMEILVDLTDDETIDLLDKQGDFYHDHSRGRVLLYSTSNPATYYTDIECVLYKKHMFSMSSKSYIDINNLAMKYGGAHAVFASDSHHIKINDNDISYIGGSIQGGVTRFGNGVELLGSNNNVYVERNRIWEIFDAALTTQGDSGNMFNHFYRNNIVWNSTMCFEFWNKSSSSNVYDIYFENNTCANSGYGWNRLSGRESYIGGAAVQTYTHSANTWNVFIRNNILYQGLRSTYRLNGDINNFENIIMDYNVLYDTSSPMIYVWNSESGITSYAMSDFSSWQADSGKDANSIAANPIFVDELNNDFLLIADSPACTASDSGSFVGALPCSTDPDIDSDGILNDGDGNGIPGDNPCTGGNTLNCDDNCFNISNAAQADLDSDGVGNECDVDIHYVETDLGGGNWKYEYTVRNFTSSYIYGIFFDFGDQYYVDSPVVPGGWEILDGWIPKPNNNGYASPFMESITNSSIYDIPPGSFQSDFIMSHRKRAGTFSFRALLDDHNGTGYLVTGTTDTDSGDADLDGIPDTLDLCIQPAVRILGGASFFYSPQDAYDAANDMDIIQSEIAYFNQDMNINRNISISMRLGYDCNYTASNGETSLKGQLTVSSGDFVIENGTLRIAK